MNATSIAILCMLAALAADAGDRKPVDNDPGPPYQFTVVDLVYRVESIGGVVQDIEIKETPTEVRVDMAADVLFDFDKADLLPKADETLQKAAAMIEQRGPKGPVRIEGHTAGRGT